MRQDLQVPIDLGGDADMVGENLLDRQGRPVEDPLQLEVFAKAQPPQRIGRLPARKVARGPLELQKGGSAVDDADVPKLVGDVLQDQRPVLPEVMDLVEEHVRETMLAKVFDQVLHPVPGEPQIVQTRVEGFVRIRAERLLHALAHQRCLSRSPGPLDADQPVPPVNLVHQISMEYGRLLANLPIGRFKQLFNIFGC